MHTITYTVTAISPLLMSNPAGMLSRPAKAGVTVKQIPSPEEEAASRVYRLPSGQLYGPAQGLHAGVILASAGRRIGKVSAKTVLQGALFVLDLEVPLVRAKTGKPIMQYDEIHLGRCVVQQQGVLRARPLVKDWAGTVRFEFYPDFLKPEWITEMFMLAGRTKGWLDWRPGLRGPFGRYSVKLVEHD